MSTLRILHVVTYMGLGGLETMLMNYYRKIDRERIQYDFLVHRNERAYYDEEIENLGGRIHRVPKLNPFSKSYKDSLKSFFKAHPEYKIVHVHQDCLSGIILKVAKECGVPVRIAHSHSSSQDKNLKYLIKFYFKRVIPQYSTHLLACGKKAGEWMFSGEKFEILNNAIDASKYVFSPEKRIKMREKLNIDSSKFVIGHVANFSDAKNHSFLLDVFSEIIQKHDAMLLLVGDGSLRAKTEEKAQALGIYEKVMFLGRRNDVHDIMQAMDVFVLPSKYEGFPVSVVEAQSSGLGCLISDKVPLDCKITDLVEQVALDSSLEHWANKILEARHYERKSTIDSIKANGFDVEENAKKLTDFYFSVSERK